MKSDWVSFIKGDYLAFQKIYEEYVDDLFSFGMSIHPDRDLVLDAIHDLFLGVYNNSRIAREVNIKSYLFSSLRRLVLKKRHQRGVSVSMDENIDLQVFLRQHSVEDEIIDSEREIKIKKILLNSIEHLPRRQREVIHLRFYMNLSYEEISKIMEVNVATCRTLCYRALKLLKQQLPSLKHLLFLLFFIK